jgi:uncharacterized protein
MISPANAEGAGWSHDSMPDMRADFDVDIPMRDGTILRADIYRPLGKGRVPALLTRTPYDKRHVHRSAMGINIRTATARGYAVVAQDVRGRFASEGEFLVTPTQAVEGPDGYDTIEWLARQPWCDGAIGMFGLSYLSLTQLMAATERPPSLRAIAPEKTGNPSCGGVMLDSAMIAWTAGQAMDWVQKAMLRQEAGEKELAIIQQTMTDPQAAARHLPLNSMPLLQIGGLPKFQEMIDLFHSQSDMDIAAIDVPALIVSSWYDIDPSETARIYATLRNRKNSDGDAIEANVIFGPWDHANNGSGLGEVFFGLTSNSEVAGIPSLYYDFFDRHLKGDASKPAPGARYFIMGSNQWRSAPHWPPDNQPQLFYLSSQGSANSRHGDGRLSHDLPPAEMPADRYRYDPLDPVPSIGGRYFEAGGSRPGPFNQQQIEERKDVLVYTSDPLATGLEIAGGVRLRVFVDCSTPDTDLAAKLCDVRPDGVSYNIVDAFFRCRWREGFDKVVLFAPGKIYEFDIDLGPVAHFFRPGHRLRLQLTSSAFPHFDRNMNTGHAIGVDAEGLVADVTVFHDSERPAALLLPVTDGRAKT